MQKGRRDNHGKKAILPAMTPVLSSVIKDRGDDYELAGSNFMMALDGHDKMSTYHQ